MNEAHFGNANVSSNVQMTIVQFILTDEQSADCGFDGA